MKLYKNVDIKDLNSIMEKGLVPRCELEDSSWNLFPTSDKPTDVVYLFRDTKEYNSITFYGLALLEIEVDDFKENERTYSERHYGNYREYTSKKVEPSRIKKIYLPLVLKERITDLSSEVLELVEWVEVEGKEYHLTMQTRIERKCSPKEIFDKHLGECDGINSDAFAYLNYIDPSTCLEICLCELNYKFKKKGEEGCGS